MQLDVECLLMEVWKFKTDCDASHRFIISKKIAANARICLRN